MLLYNTDCLEIMAGMEAGSVDCIITDPPYFSTNLHFDKAPRLDFKTWLLECKRVLKPDGVLISFSDFNLLAQLRSHKVFSSNYELIWEKTMSVGFLDANIRPLRNHEFIGIFTNSLKLSTYNPQKTVGEAYTRRQKTVGEAYNIMAHTGQERTITTSNTGDRHPKSVLKFSNGNNNSLHPTQKPLDLLMWLMRSYTNERDVVFDCFMGSGTTGHAAILLNRKFIGCELDSNYFSVAKARIEESQHDLINFFGVI